MDNNVIVPVILIMRACTLHNVGYENNVHCLPISGAVFASIEDKNKKK